jgi:hypothetical protein
MVSRDEYRGTSDGESGGERYENISNCPAVFVSFYLYGLENEKLEKLIRIKGRVLFNRIASE